MDQFITPPPRTAKLRGPNVLTRKKDVVIRILLNNERADDAVAKRLVEEFSFALEAADAALGLDFPPGYVNLFLVAINKLLPHLERGLVDQPESSR